MVTPAMEPTIAGHVQSLEEVAGFLDMEEDKVRASQRNLDGTISRVHRLHEDL
jgi:hypothetical protein